MAKPRRSFAVCVRNEGYEVSLELRKIYEVVPDKVAARHRQVRETPSEADIMEPRPSRGAPRPRWEPVERNDQRDLLAGAVVSACDREATCSP